MRLFPLLALLIHLIPSFFVFAAQIPHDAGREIERVVLDARDSPTSTTITVDNASDNGVIALATGSSTSGPTTTVPTTTTTALSAASQNTTNGETNPTQPGELPLQPEITPALGLGGFMLLSLGSVLAMIGIRNLWVQIFLSTAFLTSLGVTVLIVYVMNPPVRVAVQGAYLVAIFFTGVTFGALSIVFKELTEGLGCLLGGFCCSMWLLALKSGGLLAGTDAKAGFVGAMSVAFYALSFSQYTRPYGLIVSTAISGGTAVALGIDCFSRAGLKEFWLYIWALNGDIFPLGTNTYPVTRNIRVELAVTVIVAILGVVSQLRLWKVVRERRRSEEKKREEEQKEKEEAEAEVGRRLEEHNMRERREWEAKYGNGAPPDSPLNDDPELGDDPKKCRGDLEKGQGAETASVVNSSQKSYRCSDCREREANDDGFSEVSGLEGSQGQHEYAIHKAGIKKGSETQTPLPFEVFDATAVAAAVAEVKNDDESDLAGIVGSEAGTIRSRRFSGMSMLRRMSGMSIWSSPRPTTSQSQEVLVTPEDDDSRSSEKGFLDDGSITSEAHEMRNLNVTKDHDKIKILDDDKEDIPKQDPENLRGVSEADKASDEKNITDKENLTEEASAIKDDDGVKEETSAEQESFEEKCTISKESVENQVSSNTQKSVDSEKDIQERTQNIPVATMTDEDDAKTSKREDQDQSNGLTSADVPKSLSFPEVDNSAEGHNNTQPHTPCHNQDATVKAESGFENDGDWPGKEPQKPDTTVETAEHQTQEDGTDPTKSYPEPISSQPKRQETSTSRPTSPSIPHSNAKQSKHNIQRETIPSNKQASGLVDHRRPSKVKFKSKKEKAVLNAETVKHIPERTSKVVQSHRTNEWAKHLSAAEAPEPEPINPLEEEKPQNPVEVKETAAPVNVRQLLQTPLNAQPPPAIESRRVSLSKESLSQEGERRLSNNSSLPQSDMPRSDSRRNSPNPDSIRPLMQLSGNLSTPAINYPRSSPIPTHSFHVLPSATNPFMQSTSAVEQPRADWESAKPKWKGPPPLLAVREDRMRSRLSSTSLSTDPWLSRNQRRSAETSPISPTFPIPEEGDDLPLSQRRAILHQQTTQISPVTVPQSSQRRSYSGASSPADAEAVMAAWRESVREDLTQKQDLLANRLQSPAPGMPERSHSSLGLVHRNSSTIHIENTIAEGMQRGDMSDLHREAMRRMQATANRKVNHG